eukprot:14091411-Ditylum_brightwellii.AAC.1
MGPCPDNNAAALGKVNGGFRRSVVGFWGRLARVFGLGAERCLWSKLGVRRCVEDAGRWYLLWCFGGFGRALRCSATQHLTGVGAKVSVETLRRQCVWYKVRLVVAVSLLLATLLCWLQGQSPPLVLAGAL